MGRIKIFRGPLKGSGARGERAFMAESPESHFHNQNIVPDDETLDMGPPSLGFRMTRVALTAAPDNRDKAVQLSMLTKQAPVTQKPGVHIPYPHINSLRRPAGKRNITVKPIGNPPE